MVERRGAAAIEYALLLSLVAIAVIAGVQRLQSAIKIASYSVSNATSGQSGSVPDVRLQKKAEARQPIDDW